MDPSIRTTYGPVGARRSVAAVLALLAFAVAALLVAPQPAAAVEYVIDEAHLLSPAEISAIDTLSATLEAKAQGAQVAVVTVRSLGGRSIEEYANERFRALGIGQKGKDNGVMLLVAPTDRKVRIEVGYGLEGALPDSAAGDIVDRIILPRFKAGTMTEGIVEGHRAIVAVVAAEYKVAIPGLSAADAAASEDPGPFGPFALVAFIILVIVVLRFVFGPRRPGGRGGGGGSPWSGGWTSGDSSGSGWDSGGSSSSGGGDFGGGSSGGGGASGDW